MGFNSGFKGLNQRSCVGFYVQRVWEVGQMHAKYWWIPGRGETSLV